MYVQLKGYSYMRLATTDGIQMYNDLEVGVHQSQSIKAHANQTGSDAHIALEANSRDEADLSVNTHFLWHYKFQC